MAVRYTLQAELYATPARLNQLEADANAAMSTRVDLIGPPTVRQQTIRGTPELLVEADFTSSAGGQEIIATIVARAQQRQAADPSYVRLSEVDDVNLTIVRRVAESVNAWAVVVTGPTPL